MCTVEHFPCILMQHPHIWHQFFLSISTVAKCLRMFEQNAWQQSVIMNLQWEHTLLFPHCLTVSRGGNYYLNSKCLWWWLIHCVNIVSDLSPCLRYVQHA
jgi:hypothetical protein